MYYYKLTGSAAAIQRIIDYFTLRIERKHSNNDVDVEVDASYGDDVETMAETLGVHWREI